MLEEVPKEQNTRAMARQIQLVFLSVLSSTEMDPPYFLPLVAGRSVALARLDRTLEEASGSFHIDHRVPGIECRRRVGFGMWGRTLPVVAC